jgi:hypothetical protein
VKKLVPMLVLFLTLNAILFAQESISRHLYSFSPLGKIYVRELGMEDKNQNGTIDAGTGEGYEQFIAKYGNADIGFAANGVTFGAANNVLEEPEIINHYYINIRFKEPVETETIENAVSSYIYANNIPLVWLDDEQGTVMNAVNHVLGEGWNEQEVTEDEAVNLSLKVMNKLNISGRMTNINDTGYYSLPEAITRKSSYCFEITQFQFWFFSQLRINSIAIIADLTPSISHEVIYLPNTKTMIDYFRTSRRYDMSKINWTITNPLQVINDYYMALDEKTYRNNNLNTYINYLEQALSYNRYDIDTLDSLIHAYEYDHTYTPEDVNVLIGFIADYLNQEYSESNSARQTFKTLLYTTMRACENTSNITGLEKIKNIFNKYLN